MVKHNDRKMIPSIGREISWKESIGQVFRVINFDRTDTVVGQGDRVVTTGGLRPYGYLLVESPRLKDKYNLPIGHKDDFLLASTIFDQESLVQKINTNLELLVTYFPMHKLPFGLGGIRHGFHFVITPRGTLEDFLYKHQEAQHTKGVLEKLFSKFVYHGLIRVQINQNPEY